MSRQKANFEPLYPYNATTFDENQVIRTLRHAEARGMADRKETIRFCKQCGRTNDAVRCRSNTAGQHKMVSKLKEARRDTRSTPTITIGEVHAVAGTGFERGNSKTLDHGETYRHKLLADGVVRQLEDAIELAVVKVDEWPLTGDNRAVRVPGVSRGELARLNGLRELRMLAARS